MEQEIKLEKALSPTQVTALALGSIVGWGCFVLPGDMFLPQAGPLGTLLGFLAGAILISFVGVCYSYMIKYAPLPVARSPMPMWAMVLRRLSSADGLWLLATSPSS